MNPADWADGEITMPVTRHLEEIYSLLRNGTNVQVILVKAIGDIRVTYELVKDEREA
jgi:hypothetical protein